MYKLKQLVTEPTRENAILDKVYKDYPLVYNSCQILPSIGKSDHACIMVHGTGSAWKEPTSHLAWSRCAGRNERAALSGYIKDINWTNLHLSDNLKEKINLFNDTVNTMINTSMPMKYIRRNSNDKPWITDHFRDLIARRQAALLRGSHEEYARLRNQINRSSKKLKKKYYSDVIENEQNPRKLFSKLLNMTGIKEDIRDAGYGKPFVQW